MVIPWRGFPLADLIRRVDPQPSAQFVEFTTVYRPREMVGQRTGILEWPYIEGLRMDEAMHPLTLLVTGVYGFPGSFPPPAPFGATRVWRWLAS